MAAVEAAREVPRHDIYETMATEHVVCSTQTRRRTLRRGAAAWPGRLSIALMLGVAAASAPNSRKDSAHDSASGLLEVEKARKRTFIRRDSDEGVARHRVSRVGTGVQQCQFHDSPSDCLVNKTDCLSCEISGAVTNTNVDHGSTCIAACGENPQLATVKPCPDLMLCDGSGSNPTFYPRGNFQCLDMANRCCIPYVRDAPWPPCLEDNEGVFGHDDVCTTKCNVGFTATIETVRCNGAEAMMSSTFTCISDSVPAR